ncbi:MAG: ComEA family DNA-binding protein [Gammaproteobacteria bacterium]|nr:ComEA family DNA-binding protein [Gammaproteobacteria bacterium]
MKRIPKLFAALVLGGVAVLATAADRIDINRADAAALAQLHGVGAARAEAIVAERESNGPFRSIEDLVRVKGLGQAVIERNRDRVTVDNAPQAGAAN